MGVLVDSDAVFECRSCCGGYGSGRLARNVWESQRDQTFYHWLIVCIIGAIMSVFAMRQGVFWQLNVLASALLVVIFSYRPIRYSIIGKPLYHFIDARGVEHLEETYPVSIEPTQPRAKETMPARPVLRIFSGWFRKDGCMIDGVRCDMWKNERITARWVTSGGAPEILYTFAEDRVDSLLNPYGAKRIQLRLFDLSIEKLLYAMEYSRPTVRLQQSFTVENERNSYLKEACKLTAQVVALGDTQRNIGVGVLKVIQSIAASKDKRTPQSHPGLIRKHLEWALFGPIDETMARAVVDQTGHTWETYRELYESIHANAPTQPAQTEHAAAAPAPAA